MKREAIRFITFVAICGSRCVNSIVNASLLLKLTSVAACIASRATDTVRASR